ncbi:MAG: FtsX-like permease family protein [Candidatus Izemoplasmatales bacterium]
MKLAFNIAKRFLLSAKKQTIVIILGIAVGVSVQVFIGSLISGLQKDLVDTTIGSQSQITLANDESNQYINDYTNIIANINDNQSNIKSITPTITTSGQLSINEDNENIVFRGFEFSSANEIYKIEEKLVENSTMPNSSNEILLGLNLKETLDLKINDKVYYNDNNPSAKSNVELTVVGFVDFKVLDLNSSWVVSNLETTQDILNIQTTETLNVEMQLKDVFEAANTRDSILLTLNQSNIEAVTWIEKNEDLLAGLEGQSISSLMIQIFVIISVVLGISSVLAITVLQKSKQLGILKAMGIKDRDASKIFLFEGFILGLFGAIMGILLGISLLFVFSTFATTSDGSPVVPLDINPGFIALSALIALTASTLAALSPAIKSSKLSVIEVIRNG